ncbi:uncharacterized protein [Antedon mediterranea]|uniref:uncharacterized protein isoform X2 n=1 Tax=Antedon mediterranea TaxID=105859 RepID=UPI003AF8410B
MTENDTIAMQLDLFRVANKCVDIRVKGVATTNGGAQWTVTFDPIGDGERKIAPYWIVETDYDNYALIYGCNADSHGACSHRENIVYVMSRQPTLSKAHMEQIDQLLPSLCIKKDDIILTNQEECRGLNMIGAEKGLTVPGFSHVPKALPSLHLTPRKCNPEREAYGCCTFIDAPAVGPNEQGCPNFQEIKSAVNTVNQKRGKCWKDRQTATVDGAISYLTCNYDGSYTEVQCDKSMGACWCVDKKNGQRKLGSVSTANMEKPDCRLSNCQRHRKRIDGYQSRRNMKKKSFYRPVCEKNGKYSAIQCFNSWRYCWCVDEHTGKKVQGSLAQGMLPVCDNRRESLNNRLESGKPGLV